MNDFGQEIDKSITPRLAQVTVDSRRPFGLHNKLWLLARKSRRISSSHQKPRNTSWADFLRLFWRKLRKHDANFVTAFVVYLPFLLSHG